MVLDYGLDPRKSGDQREELDRVILFQPERTGAPLLAHFMRGPWRESWTMTSTDNGHTWTAAVIAPTIDHEYMKPAEHFRLVHQEPPLEILADGHPLGKHTLLYSADNQNLNQDLRSTYARTHITRVPPDNYTGRTGGGDWVLQTGPTAGTGDPIGGGFLVHGDDYRTIQHVARNGVNASAVAQWSTDGGRTWGAWESLGAGVDAGMSVRSLDLHNGGPLKGWHLATGTRHHTRAASKVFASRDGRTWTEVLHLSNGYAQRWADPTIVQADDRLVHILYTSRDHRHGVLRHVIIDPDVLIGDLDRADPGFLAPVTDRTMPMSKWGHQPEDMGVVLSVQRLGGDRGAASVRYRTRDGDAIAGEDYVAATGTLSWADGEMGTKSVVIATLDDARPEGIESFFVDLEDAAGAPLSGTARVECFITDFRTDSASGGTAALPYERYEVFEDAADPSVYVDVWRNSGTGAAFVDLEIVPITAGADDVDTTTITLDLRQHLARIPIRDDALAEGDETFRIRLTNPVDVTLGTRTEAIVTIIDDDGGGGGSAQRRIGAQVLRSGAAVDVAVTLTPGGGTSTGTGHSFAGLDPAVDHVLSFAELVAASLGRRGRQPAAVPPDQGRRSSHCRGLNPSSRLKTRWNCE